MKKMIGLLAFGVMSGVYAADRDVVVTAWQPSSPSRLRLATAAEETAEIGALRQEAADIVKTLIRSDCRSAQVHRAELEKRFCEISVALVVLNVPVVSFDDMVQAEVDKFKSELAALKQTDSSTAS